jgi:predicted DNA-binding transcriptional regulator YafY
MLCIICKKKIDSSDTLLLNYQKYNGEKSQRVIHPKLIVRWGESLLVESHDELRNEMRRFNLIRIKKLKPIK